VWFLIENIRNAALGPDGAAGARERSGVKARVSAYLFGDAGRRAWRRLAVHERRWRTGTVNFQRTNKEKRFTLNPFFNHSKTKNNFGLFFLWSTYSERSVEDQENL
jgi:hypothetical protein